LKKTGREKKETWGEGTVAMTVGGGRLGARWEKKPIPRIEKGKRGGGMGHGGGAIRGGFLEGEGMGKFLQEKKIILGGGRRGEKGEKKQEGSGA